MADLNNAASTDAAAEDILSKISDLDDANTDGDAIRKAKKATGKSVVDAAKDDAETDDKEQAEAADTADDTEAEPAGETDGEAETAEEEEQAEESDEDHPGPAIEPPNSWSNEEKAAFSKFHPDAQKAIVRVEKAREARFSKGLQEVADKSKTLDGLVNAAESERKITREMVQGAYVAARQANPLIANGDKTDWNKFFAENPKEAASEQAVYRQAVDVFNAGWNGMVEQLKKGEADSKAKSDKEKAEQEAREVQEGLKVAQDHDELGPLLNDPAKRVEVRDKMAKDLVSRGFSPAEIKTLTDGRLLIGIYEAMKYRELKTTLSKADKKRPQQPTAKVIRPQGSEPAQRVSETSRVKALKQRAQRTGKLDDQAAYILGSL